MKRFSAVIAAFLLTVFCLSAEQRTFANPGKMPQIKEKVDNMRNQIFDELDLKIKEGLSRLEGLKSQLARKEEFKAENDAFIAKSHAASKELIKLAQDYGYEF